MDERQRQLLSKLDQMEDADKARQRVLCLERAFDPDDCRRHIGKPRSDLTNHKQWNQCFEAAWSAVERGSIIALIGPRGTGKTQLAVELIRRGAYHTWPCRYIRSREVGMLLREAFRKDGLTERQAVRSLSSPKLLVIDEIQERPDTTFEKDTFTLVLDKRYAACRPTVLIANATIKEFAELVGQSVADRIREGGGVRVCNWASFRRTI